MIDLRCAFRYFLYILMQLYMMVSFELQAGVFATRSALFLSDHRRLVSYIYIYIYWCCRNPRRRRFETSAGLRLLKPPDRGFLCSASCCCENGIELVCSCEELPMNWDHELSIMMSMFQTQLDCGCPGFLFEPDKRMIKIVHDELQQIRVKTTLNIYSSGLSRIVLEWFRTLVDNCRAFAGL